ncbi:MAG: hypothetical protein FWG90_09165 [Oscillospiraceae bacterium]|nr:hypothetical protein [Oscillospiraceae bacterium]MCL2054581.1 hypothetical protein [Oscillospiraceae bacterium]
METTTIFLRSILYQLKRAENLNQAISAVSVMCSKDDIAVVEKEILALKETQSKNLSQ